MATSLKIESTDGARNTYNTNVNYINESCADGTLRTFADKLFELSNNTVHSVAKITTTDITNAQPEPTGYVINTPGYFSDWKNYRYANLLGVDLKSAVEKLERDSMTDIVIDSLTIKRPSSAIQYYVPVYKINYTNEGDQFSTEVNGKTLNELFVAFRATYNDDSDITKATVSALIANNTYEDLGFTVEEALELYKTGKFFKVLAAAYNYKITNTNKTDFNVLLEYDETSNSLKAVPRYADTEIFGVMFTGSFDDSITYTNEQGESILYPEYEGLIVPKDGVIKTVGNKHRITLGNFEDW